MDPAAASHAASPFAPGISGMVNICTSGRTSRRREGQRRGRRVGVDAPQGGRVGGEKPNAEGEEEAWTRLPAPRPHRSRSTSARSQGSGGESRPLQRAVVSLPVGETREWGLRSTREWVVREKGGRFSSPYAGELMPWALGWAGDHVSIRSWAAFLFN